MKRNPRVKEVKSIHPMQLWNPKSWNHLKHIDPGENIFRGQLQHLRALARYLWYGNSIETKSLGVFLTPMKDSVSVHGVCPNSLLTRYVGLFINFI